MTTSQTQTPEKQSENGNRPDWIAKAPKGYGRKQKLERVGAAWTRPDGGICLRLHGTQIVSDDIYLYPATRADDEGAQ